MSSQQYSLTYCATMDIINDSTALAAWVNEVLALPPSQDTSTAMGDVCSAMNTAYEVHRTRTSPPAVPPADPEAVVWLGRSQNVRAASLWAALHAFANSNTPDTTRLCTRLGYLVDGLKGCNIKFTPPAPKEPNATTTSATSVPEAILKMAIVSMPERMTETRAQRDDSGNITGTKTTERDVEHNPL